MNHMNINHINHMIKHIKLMDNY